MAGLPLAEFYAYRNKPVADKYLTASYKVLLEAFPTTKFDFLKNEKDYVGIEVEVENITNDILGNLVKTPVALWTAKEDGSLRNHGVEFVTVPIPGYLVPLAVQQLKASFEKANPKYTFSKRTSVHIHVNARSMSIEEIISTIFVYTIVERLLYRWVKHNVGVDRSCNIFCLPINQTYYHEVIGNRISDIIEYLGYDEDIRIYKKYNELVQSWKKYLGINLLRSTDANCGTIEFRHLSGTIDVKHISTWVGFLLKIKAYAKENTLDSIINTILGLNTNSEYELFLRKVFGELAYELSCTNIKGLVEDNVSFIKECLEYKDSKDRVLRYRKIPYSKFKESTMYTSLLNRGISFQSEKKELKENKKELAEAVRGLEDIREVIARDFARINPNLRR